MAAFAEICRAYPLSAFLLIFGPFIGAVLTAASGYEGLKARLSTDQQATRIEMSVETLATPAETIRRYEMALTAQGQRSALLSQIVDHYDHVKQLVGVRMTGKTDTAERLGTAERAIADLRTSLQSVATVALMGHEALVLQGAPNTFQVTYSVPPPFAPKLAFFDLPKGAAATVLEPSRFGFTVVFTPSHIQVQRFGVSANAGP